jgi:hypothetical protein
MFNSVLDYNNNQNSQLQIDCVSFLNNIFLNIEIKNLIIKNYLFKGVRGKFDGLNNYSLSFDFNYFDYYFEFNLSFDQLEYYISKDDELLKECNLEDFWEDKILIEKFITYLKKDLKKLEILFNE